MTDRPHVAGTYEDLAEEYYDPARHPTSANFRDGSLMLLERSLSLRPSPDGELWDVGAGDSVLAEVLARAGKDLSRVTAVDSSARMLEHSRRWRDLGVELA